MLTAWVEVVLFPFSGWVFSLPSVFDCTRRIFKRIRVQEPCFLSNLMLDTWRNDSSNSALTFLALTCNLRMPNVCFCNAVIVCEERVSFSVINSTSSQTYTPFENPVPLISFLVFEFVCFSSDPKKEQIPLAGWRVLFVGFVCVCLWVFVCFGFV